MTRRGEELNGGVRYLPGTVSTQVGYNVQTSCSPLHRTAATLFGFKYTRGEVHHALHFVVALNGPDVASAQIHGKWPNDVQPDSRRQPRETSLKNCLAINYKFVMIAAKWMNRGVITAVMKWRGRSSVERAAAILSLGSRFLVGAAIPANQ